jgi:hypothetical protein
MSFLKAVEVTNAVFIILNSREGLKKHLKGGRCFAIVVGSHFLSCRSPGSTPVYKLSSVCLEFVYALSTLNKQVSKARWDNSVRQCKTVSYLTNYVTSYAISYATAGSYLAGSAASV